MSYTKIWIHAVITTKRRRPYLKGDIKQTLIGHIRSNAKKKGIYIDTINGYHEHLHILIKLNPDMSIANAMQLIKGESAHWMNKESIIDRHFEWGVDYYAASVSESELTRVRNYIRNQEAHHDNKSFADEEDEFTKEYGLQLIKSDTESIENDTI